MEWKKHDNLLLYDNTTYRPNDVLFISIQNGLIRSKSTKKKASGDDWVFYSQDTPNYINGLKSWLVVFYDYGNNTNLIESVLKCISRKYIAMVINQDIDVVKTFTKHYNIFPSPASCVVTEETLLLTCYKSYEIFPEHKLIPFPKGPGLYITVGHYTSGREQVFGPIYNDEYIRITEEKHIEPTLLSGKSVIFQGNNVKRADRKRLIAIANKFHVTPYIFLFTRRTDYSDGDDYSNNYEIVYPSEAKIYRVN